MSEAVTITKEELRRALVAGWDSCIPRFHMDLDRTWEALKTGVRDDVKAGGLYALDSFECWGTDEDEDESN